MSYDKPPQNNERIESEKLIAKLGLKKGKELSLVKKSLTTESALPVGREMKGILKEDVKVGSPLLFEHGANTSNIVSIKEVGGIYTIKTLTSVYEIIIPVKESKNIKDFVSFETARGSVYHVLENGQTQRIKYALDDPHYRGDDKGESKERAPSDVIIFYNPQETKDAGWFNDFMAIDPHTGKSIGQSIDIGVYVENKEGNYQAVKNSADLGSSFIFLRVRKDDSFKLKEIFSFSELYDFQMRTLDPKNRGLGVLIPSDNENINISNIPRIGWQTVDYKCDSNGVSTDIHGGNKIISIKEKE